MQKFFRRVKTHTTFGGPMKNETLTHFIKEKFYEEKMSAEYQLQLTKIAELEDKFTKDFSKDKWREYFNLDLEKGQLHLIEIDIIIEFIIRFLETN